MHGESDLEGAVCVENRHAKHVGRRAGQNDVVALVGGDEGHEGGDALLARVAEAPAVVLWPVYQVQIAVVGEDGHWTQSPVFSVVIHAFNDEHSVFEAVAFVGLPVFFVSAL